MNILKSTPFILLCVIVCALLICPLLPLSVITFFYTLSVLFKDILTIALPLIVFSFVFAGVRSFEKGAPIVLGVLLATIVLSNGLIALLTYAVMSLVGPHVFCQDFADVAVVTPIKPLVQLPIPAWFSGLSLYALIAAVVFGVFFSVTSFRPPYILHSLKRYIKYFVESILVPLLPIYVFGFALKLCAEGSLRMLITHYAGVCLAVVALQLLVLVLCYLIAAGGSFGTMIQYVTVALPSYLTALATMSSTATIPVSVKAAQENTGNESLSDLAIPIMANIHLAGDAVLTPMLIIATMVLFGECMPSFGNYLMFIPYFCIAMLGVAGVPGGGILVMVPLLKAHFGFTSAMVNIVISLYLLMDPFGTSANVMGDGALVIIVNNLLKRLGLRSSV